MVSEFIFHRSIHAAVMTKRFGIVVSHVFLRKADVLYER